LEVLEEADRDDEAPKRHVPSRQRSANTVPGARGAENAGDPAEPVARRSTPTALVRARLQPRDCAPVGGQAASAGAPAQGGRGGRRIVNWLPTPGSLVTRTSPPRASTKRRTMWSPRPTPPPAVPGTCRNMSNTTGRASAGMPQPVSTTLIWTPPVGSALASSVTVPRRVNLSALCTRL